MEYCKLRCFLAIGFAAFVLASSTPAQVPTPTPTPASPTPFIADPTQAERIPANASPTPSPNLNFPVQPLGTPVPQPSPTPRAQGGNTARAMPVAPRDVITRLQIFLDQRNFGPGKIDGGWGEFTAKALIRYQIATGRKPTGQIDPDMQAELNKLFPIYTNYTLT